MIRGVRWLVVALVLGLSSAAAAAPSDAEKKQARALMEEGDAAAASKDHARALEKYRAADAIMHVPTTGLEVARMLVAVGRLIEARDAALAVTRLPPGPDEPEAFASARARAEQLAASIADRIPSLEVMVKGIEPGADFELRIDGKVVPAAAAKLPQKLDPGKHFVVVSSRGRRAAKKAVDLAEGVKDAVEIVLAPPGATTDAEPAATKKTEPEAVTGEKKTSSLVYIGFGAAAVGLAVGSVTGFMSLGKAASAKDQCSGNRCPPAAKDDIDSSKSLANISNVGFGVAIVGAAIGVYGLMSGKSGKETASRRARVEPRIGAGFAGVGGAF